MMISPYLAFSEISKVSPFPPCLEGRCQLTRHDNVLALFFKASEAVSAVSRAMLNMITEEIHQGETARRKLTVITLARAKILCRFFVSLLW